jgi:hypothetical protein
MEPWPAAPRTVAELRNRVLAVRDLDRQQFTSPHWLWQGYLGAGKVTLLTSQWKSGKTTLAALLLARMQQGGQMAGLPVAPSKALVISEESAADWRLRLGRLAVRDQHDLLCRPFLTQPTMEQWLQLIETAALMHEHDGTGLVVIDSLAQFLPAHAENSAGALLECLTPLQRLTTAGMAVLLLHHPHKGKTLAGQAARGSGALPSFVDILMEMGHYTHPEDPDRRRRLVAFSRYDETPRHLLMELEADGSDYTLLQTGPDETLPDNWQGVLSVLDEAYTKLTRSEILANWPEDFQKPDASTLYRWLDRAVAQGQVRQQGSGLRRDPFRYWLPERDELMRPDNGTHEEMQAWSLRCRDEIVERLDLKNECQAASQTARRPHDDPEAAPPPTAVQEATAGCGPAPPPARADGPATPVPAPPQVNEQKTPLPAPASPQVNEQKAPPRAEPTGSPAAQCLDPPAALPPAPTSPLQVDQPKAPAPAEPPVRLPWPFNTMKPEEVPEEVWQKAREKARGVSSG